MQRPPPEELEATLKQLANVNRLRLLETLQTPRRLAEIELAPSREDGWGSSERAISRQGIKHHLQALLELGVVTPAATAQGDPGYVVNHAMLFGVVEQLRTLATIRGAVDVAHDTAPLRAGGAAGAVAGPHLVLARGVHEGRAFPLEGKEEWVLGRSSRCDAVLDYDPYISSEHARIVRKPQGWFLQDIPTNRNGTLLNWAPMVKGGVAPLRPGDVVGIGMSLLVFRA